MANGETPLSAELLTERLAHLARELPEIRKDIHEIRKSQESQAISSAQSASLQTARMEGVEARLKHVEGDIETLRRRVNGWNMGNTVLAAIGSFLAVFLGTDG